MTTEQKLAVDSGIVAWSWTFPYTLSQTNEFVQLVVGLLTIVLVVMRIYGAIAKEDE